MYRGAIGIVETIGQVGSVEAADAMTKCADVELLGREDVGGGYHAVCVRGDVGSVRASLEAGERAAAAVGRVVGTLFIPRPHDDLDAVLAGFGGAPVPLVPPQSVLEGMNVHELRNLVRRLNTSALHGRDVSRANRQQLLDAIREDAQQPEQE